MLVASFALRRLCVGGLQQQRTLAKKARQSTSLLKSVGGSVSLLSEQDGDWEVPKISKKFVSTPFAYHTELVLTIDDVTNLGVGVGRVELPSARSNSSDANMESSLPTSWVVFVPLVLPGEKVRVRIFRNAATYSEADLVEVLTPSPDRVVPECKYFSICGGCQYQHMSVSAQRKWKRNQVVSLLERIGNLPGLEVDEVIGTTEHFGYRSKITPHYNAPKAEQELKIGFQQRGTRIVIDVDQCIIATPAINQVYTEVRKNLTREFKIKLPKKGATLLFRDGHDGVETDFSKNMRQSILGKMFTFKAGEFFQVNPFALPLIVKHVLELASGDGCTRLIDAYCGSGLFSVCADGGAFESIHGVEVSEWAVKAAVANAKENGVRNAQFTCGSSEAIFSKVQHLPADNTVIIIDPPRKGCDDVFLKQLFAFRPKKIVYVSCDPATQARDAKDIVEQGGYRVQRITPFDLFPQTRHIENVMCFLRD